jgi:hypothetical protein
MSEVHRIITMSLNFTEEKKSKEYKRVIMFKKSLIKLRQKKGNCAYL